MAVSGKDTKRKKCFITGAAGFIGFHLAKHILTSGYEVAGFDNLNSYYDPRLKETRLSILRKYPHFSFYKGDMTDYDYLLETVTTFQPDIVVNLAAQAGVRYSIDEPRLYIDSNVVGFFNLLEVCRHRSVEHLVFASSSSVYGNRNHIPFSVKDWVDYPISLYAATKKTNELMAYTYSHLYGIPVTGLRFFTVYGPYGRPDMAYYKFAESIYRGETIKVYNGGDMLRDFTYVDDVVTGIMLVMNSAPIENNGVRYKIYNIGHGHPIKLMDFIEILETALGRTAKKKYLPMQPGDVYQTYADMSEMKLDFNFTATTSIYDGITKFASWYIEYCGENK